MAEPTEEREFEMSSCVRGYHVYQAIWLPLSHLSSYMVAIHQ